MEQTIYSLVNYLVLFWKNAPPVVKISTALLLLFTLVSILTVVIVIFSRVIISYKTRRNNDITERVKTFLSIMIALEEEIFEANTDESILNTITAYLKEEHIKIKDSTTRQILTQELLLIHQELAGNTADNLRKLFFLLRLDKDAIRKLRRKDWLKKAKAIHVLAQMDVIEAVNLLLPYTNDANPHLRMEAQMGYIQLHKDHPFDFLAYVDEDISEWHQLNLFATIAQNKNGIVPAFKTWLNSKNEYVIVFCLKMIGHYTQLDAISDLLRFMQHPDVTIRCAAIFALQKLETEEGVATALTMFDTADTDTKQAILNFFTEIRAESVKPFLKKNLFNDDFNLALTAAKALNNYPDSGRAFLEELLPETDNRMHKIIKHALDNRI